MKDLQQTNIFLDLLFSLFAGFLGFSLFIITIFYEVESFRIFTHCKQFQRTVNKGSKFLTLRVIFKLPGD